MNPARKQSQDVVGDPPSDEDLVRLGQAGKESAITELIRRYETRVYNLALRMTRNPADAEDVLQETFIAVMRGLARFRFESTFATWIYRIAHNTALMRLRRDSLSIPADAREESAEVQDRPFEIQDWTHDPEAVALSRETREMMDRAIDALPGTLREVFVLRDINGLSTEETADALGISVVAAKTRLHRARLALREALTGYFGEREGGNLGKGGP